MMGPVRPEAIDPIIHERVRLAIVSVLAVASELSFGELKASLALTDGNLSAHSSTLEAAGYLRVVKTFEGKRPLTTMSLTPKGREAFRNYLDTLRKIVEQGEKSG